MTGPNMVDCGEVERSELVRWQKVSAGSRGNRKIRTIGTGRERVKRKGGSEGSVHSRVVAGGGGSCGWLLL